MYKSILQSIGSGQKLERNKKDKKSYIIIQKYGKKKKTKLETVYCIPKLWYNFFSVLETLRKGWKIAKDGLKIESKKGDKTIIKFDRVTKCPTGHLTWVKVVPENDVSLVAISEWVKSIKYIDAHAKLVHFKKEVVKITTNILNWKIDENHKEPCIACALGKEKQTKIKKETEKKHQKLERNYL